MGGGATIYESTIQIPTLSTSGERFTVIVGFDGTDIVQFRVVDNLNSAKWQCLTSSGGVTTTTNTTVAPVAGTWTKMKVSVNAAATSIDFIIDGVTVATHTTNIPTGTSHQLATINYITKAVGTTERTLLVDYIYFNQVFTTPR